MEIPTALVNAQKLQQSGQLAAAEKICRDILAIEPGVADAVHLLGLIVIALKRVDEGLALLEKSLQLSPQHAMYHVNMASALHARGRLPEATAMARKAVQLNPNDPSIQFALGLALRDTNDVEGSIAAFSRAAELKPDFTVAHAELIRALRTKGRFDESLASANRLIQLAPKQPQSYMLLGATLEMMHRSNDAIAAYRTAAQIDPRSFAPLNNISWIQLELGMISEAIASITAASKLRPDLAYLNSNQLREYADDATNQSLFDGYVRWAQHYAPPQKAAGTWPNPRDAERRLRIGYVSADLRSHSVATFLEPLLRSHDASAFEITCYSTSRQSDEVSARLQQAAHRWRNAAELDDAALDRAIREDQIDILIDLGGHMANNRLMVFARKPAPVEVAYLGWQNTTGLNQIDFRITDVHVDPPGVTDPFYAERLLRLPETFAVYDPPRAAIDRPISELPALRNGHVTFGSFGKLSKVSPTTIGLWCDVLKRLPTSRLVMYANGFHSADIRTRYAGLFAERSVGMDRIDLRGGVNFDGYIAAHDHIDVVLDTFPFNGHTTACHGLWLGVPVVTLAGDRYASRMGLSVMTNLGLAHFAEHDREKFAERAAACVEDLSALAEIRRTLRDRMRSSPLMDAPRFARNFESLLRTAWRSYAEAAK